MTDLEQLLRRAASDLREAGSAFALVGGLAVSTRAEPRLTRDADLAVSVGTDAEAEALVALLVARGYVVLAAVEHLRAGRLTTARLQAPISGGPILDLLFASSGIEAECVADAEDIEVLPGLVLPVATAGHLIAMKVLARDDRNRPQDADDLVALAAVATEHDWDQAAAAVALIADRGFARERDLTQAVSELRAHGAY